MNNTHSIQDLIYLFLDGETSEIESQTLFSALSEDESLRKEFQDAITLQSSIQTVKNTTLPPDDLSSYVFSAIESNVTTTPTTILKSDVSISQKTMQFIPLTLVSLIAGGILTYVLFPSINNNTRNNSEMSLRTLRHNNVQNGIYDQKSQSNTDQKYSEYSEIANTFNKQNSEKAPSVLYSGGQSVRVEHAQKTYGNTESFSEKRALTQPLEVSNFEPISLSVSHVSQIQYSRRIQIEKFLIPQQNQFSSDTNYSDEEFSILPKFLWIKSLAGLYQYSKTEGSNIGGIENISFSALWDIGNDFYIGLEGGNEFLPTFIITNSSAGTNYTKDNTIVWGAATAWVDLDKKVRFLQNNTFDFFASASIGISEAGPIAKSQLGLSFSPLSNIHIGSSVDASLLALSGKASNATTYRTGISLLVGFNL